MRTRAHWRTGHWLRRDATLFWAGLVFVFLLALLPRLTYPLSRSVNWYNRSIAFWDALLAGDWAHTYQQYHPGVTTMWVAGLGLRVYMAAHGWSSADMYEAQTVTSGLPGQPHRAGVAALAVVIAACIGLAYVLVKRLAGLRVAFVAGCFLALDPFFIVQGKILHVDALLATFMAISALTMLTFLQHERRSALILSGVFAGLAFLTKSTSGFLLPYAALALAWHRLLRRPAADTDPRAAQGWGRRFLEVVRDIAVWGLVAGCVALVLWPAMWVRPVEMVSVIAERALFHIGTEHYNPGFFAGRVVDGNPGPLFYPAALAWKTTLVTLPAAVAAVIWLLRPAKSVTRRWPIGWVLTYACGFALLMSIAVRKELRYLLPVFPVLDILAAWGLVETAMAVGRRRRQSRRATTTVLAVALAIHGAAVIRHNPHYGTHHNLLLGGSRVAQRILPLGDQGEGLVEAAEFLNSQPRSDLIRAGLQQRGSRVFQRNFGGYTTEIDAPDADYWVFHVNPILRRLDEERWADIWDASRAREPLWSVSFDGAPYAWIYRTYADDPGLLTIEHPLDVRLGDHVSLLGYRLSAVELSPGDALFVTLYWQSDGQIAADFHVFVHLLDAEERLAAQSDGVPGQGGRPTWSWRVEEVLEDGHALDTQGLPEGAYSLHVGLYDYGTGARLPAVSPMVGRLPDDSVWVEDVVLTLP